MSVKTSKEIRLHNARLLQSTLPGGQDEMCERLGKSQSHVSAFMGRNPRKGIGDKVAREIEAAFNLEAGWLDIWHDDLHQPSLLGVQTATPKQQPGVDAKRRKDSSLLMIARNPPIDFALLEQCITDIEAWCEDEEEEELSPPEKAAVIVGIYIARASGELAHPGDIAAAIATVAAGNAR